MGEPFATYPRTYDLVHAAALFSVEKNRYNTSSPCLNFSINVIHQSSSFYVKVIDYISSHLIHADAM